MRIVIKREADGKITLQETAKVAIVTIRRPDARNALTVGMWRELERIAEAIRPRNKVVLLRGTSGSFAAGADIKEFCAMSADQAEQAFVQMERAIAAIESLPMPVIAAMDGPALGAGFVLALACDLRLGTPNVRMGLPIGRLGITVGPAFVRRIVRLIGPSRTKELVYTGRIYGAREAYRLGLINRLTGSAGLDRMALDAAGTIVRQSRRSLEAVKRAVSLCEWRQEPPWSYVDPADFAEGCAAFVQKRPPRFR